MKTKLFKHRAFYSCFKRYQNAAMCTKYNYVKRKVFHYFISHPEILRLLPIIKSATTELLTRVYHHSLVSKSDMFFF